MLKIAAVNPELGQVFTRRWVADALLDLAGYTLDKPLETLRLVEPAVGGGAFLAALLERLLERALGRGVPLDSLGDCLRCYDLDPAWVAASRALCLEALEMAGADEATARALADQWVHEGDYLLLEGEADAGADIVVGNPPYIRYDDLEPGQFARYQRRWPTLRGRGDIYIAFWERALASLKPGGVVAYICADRWMRNAYGSGLRQFVAEGFAVRAVWSMHDVDAFEAQVASYPAITIIAREQQGSVAVADTTRAFGERSARLLSKWSSGNRLRAEGPGFKAHRLHGWYSGSGLWPSGNPDRLALLQELDHLPTLGEAGVRVGIGLASGADAAYIVQDAPVERDRLLPMVTTRSLVGGRVVWAGEHLVNPWGPDGNLVDLGEYPRLASYLRTAPGVLDRFVSRKSSAKWHRTIDKVIPGLVETPKLLIPDMRPAIEPHYEPGGFYPHHNLYWLASDTWDMEVLGGLLLSDVAGAFVDSYCVKMRGGTLRLQAQYLRMIRVPHLDRITEDMASGLRAAFRARDRGAASRLAAAAYGVQGEEVRQA